MNGPLLAFLFVAAAFVFLGWFSWIGISQPNTVEVEASLQGLVFLFSFLIALGFGHSFLQSVGEALMVCLFLGIAQLRSWLRRRGIRASEWEID